MCAVTRANDGMSATKRSNRTLRSFALAAAVTLATLVTAGLGARNAEAALYVNSGYDMRAFVATGTPLFTCGTGYLGLGQISVRAPTNLGPVTAYVTYYLSTTNSLGQWYALTPTGTPEPGGYRFAPRRAPHVPGVLDDDAGRRLLLRPRAGRLPLHERAELRKGRHLSHDHKRLELHLPLPSPGIFLLLPQLTCAWPGARLGANGTQLRAGFSS